MMKELTNFPIILNAIFNITSGIRNIQSPFSLPDTALNAGESLPAAAVTAAAESLLPEILHITIGDINSAQWASLNASVGGRLHADGAPYARACFDQYDGDGSSTADQEACKELQAGYLNEKYRLSHFGSAMLTQWETCQATGEGCLLNWMNPKDGSAFSSPKTCHQGIVSRYYIDVREPSDVSAAFDFVRSTGVRLVVKNTGHDYMGRSTAPDSLTLWTRNLQGITYNPTFRPEACEEISTTSAITVGAGTVFGQVYEFAEANNITVVGGTDRTVGASGGWVQGGGHSLLSPKLGLGADRALQFKIVVPSGEYLTANACQNSDLFFALRGGGGGTFGVVTETTFKAEPNPTSIRVAKITFPAVPANWQSVVKIGVQHGIRLSEDGWSGVIGAGLVTFINTQLSLEEARESFKPYSDFAESVNGTFVIDDSPSWYQFFEKYIGANPVGLPGAPASRLVPKRHFETASSRAALEAAIIDGTTSSHFKQIHMSCPTHYRGDTENTSVTPAWRDCIWSVAVGTFWNHATSVEGIKTAYDTSTEAIRRLKELTPESGTYASEGDMHESDYEQSFWGSNYARLLSIKQKYDPQGLLDCWHCIGWKGVNDGRYSCMI